MLGVKGPFGAVTPCLGRVANNEEAPTWRLPTKKHKTFQRGYRYFRAKFYISNAAVIKLDDLTFILIYSAPVTYKKIYII